jgi:ABC-type nickel/cobalt efflux system permease component RcnA
MPEEKEHHEKEHAEKEEEQGIEEKWRKDPFSALTLGLIVILAGVLLFLAYQEIIEWEGWWAYFLLGIGCVIIITALARYASPPHRRPIFGKVCLGLILICIGSVNIYGLEEWWPLIIIVVGILIIIYGMTRARKPK